MAPGSRPLNLADRDRWWWLALLISVLAGLLAMHGLGQVVDVREASLTTKHHMSAAAQVTDGCQHLPTHDGGHLDHDDASCKSGGVGSAPTLPDRPADPRHAVPDRAAAGVVTTAAAVGRDPPSLSELQLLRI
ncbi:MAG: hypothetical protein GEV07_04570 [Streptosporangiales bacterium]|nr:hypothetical protein [Streptosporangiales bacterium]